MGRLVSVIVTVLLGFINLIKCELYPEFMNEQELEDTFGLNSFNREHPYKRSTKPPQYPHIGSNVERDDPVYKYGKKPPPNDDQNLDIPGAPPHPKGLGRAGPTVPPEERIFPAPEWPPRDDSGRDMDDLPKRLTQTHKWREFLTLINEEKKKHPPGEVMKNWEQDIAKWEGYSRQLLVRDKYAKEKALRTKNARMKAAAAAAPVATPTPRKPNVGMEPYWSLDMIDPVEQLTTTRPPYRGAITVTPFYTYIRPASLRRALDQAGEPGFPMDENPDYAEAYPDITQSRKGMPMRGGPGGGPPRGGGPPSYGGPGGGPPRGGGPPSYGGPGGGYSGGGPPRGGRPQSYGGPGGGYPRPHTGGGPPSYGSDYSPEYPAGYSAGSPRARAQPGNGPGAGPGALRMGPESGGRPGSYGGPMAPPGYGGPPGPPGNGYGAGGNGPGGRIGPPDYGQLAPPGYPGTQFGPRTQGYMGVGEPGGPSPYARGGPQYPDYEPPKSRAITSEGMKVIVQTKTESPEEVALKSYDKIWAELEKKYLTQGKFQDRRSGSLSSIFESIG